MKPVKYVFFAFAAAALTACGGGSDTPVASTSTASPSTSTTVAAASDAIDKYIGTWSVCVLPSNPQGTIIQEKITFVKATATSANVTFVQTSHSDSACTSAPNSTFTATSISELVGTKTVGADTADKVNGKPLTPTPVGPDEKDISAVVGNQLKVGNSAVGATVDAEGFPNTFDTAYVYTKQP